MALSSYSGLQTAIANLLMRDDLTNYIPDWITLCESDVNRQLQVQDMEVTTLLTVSTSNYSVSLPSDYSTFRAAYIDTVSSGISSNAKTIASVTPQTLFSNYLNGGTNSTPLAFAITGNKLRVAPIPDTTYYINFVYYQTVPALSSTNTTNWLLTQYPAVYLYGSALHSAPFLNDDGRLGMWAGLYAENLAQIKAQDLYARYGATPLQVKVV